MFQASGNTYSHKILMSAHSRLMYTNIYKYFEIAKVVFISITAKRPTPFDSRLGIYEVHHYPRLFADNRQQIHLHESRLAEHVKPLIDISVTLNRLVEPELL